MKNETSNILRHWRDAVPHDRLAHLIRDAARALTRSLQIRLAEHDVPFGHWSFLRILWESDGLTQKELSERAGVMEPTTFAAMKTMESLGYIERRQLPTNKKNIYVYLTAKGRALKANLVPLAEDVNHISVEGIDEKDLATTRRVLLRMIEGLARDDMGKDAVPAGEISSEDSARPSSPRKRSPRSAAAPAVRRNSASRP